MAQYTDWKGEIPPLDLTHVDFDSLSDDVFGSYWNELHVTGDGVGRVTDRAVHVVGKLSIDMPDVAFAVRAMNVHANLSALPLNPAKRLPIWQVVDQGRVGFEFTHASILAGGA